MSRNTKIQLTLCILIGCIFLIVGIYQWYDLHQIEQGLKDGGLSIILHKVYEMAGKWGVASVYMPFTIYCFWRAYNIISQHNNNDEEYADYDDNIRNKENEQ